MTKLHDIIKALASESSTTKKTEILMLHKDNAALKEAFFMTLDPFTNFYIRATLVTHVGDKDLDLATLLAVKANLAGRVVTGHAARDYLIEIMGTLTADSQVILKRIINHDLECKVAGGLVNRVWPGLITEFPVMLADKFNDKTMLNVPEGPDAIIVQMKADGGRVEIVVDPAGAVSVYSRNGNLLVTHGVFDDTFSKFPNQVFDGELLVVDDEGINDRATGNGIFNKAVRGTVSIPEAKKFHIVLWDMIPLNNWKAGYCSVPYNYRLKVLIDAALAMHANRVSIVETAYVSTYAQVIAFYNDMVSRGEEGAMVKPYNMPWEARRSKFCLKLKEVKDATLLCIGITPHSKNPLLIGSLECVTSDDLLNVSIGTGLNDADRLKSPDHFIGKLIDMTYNAIITKKGETMLSMFLPVYKNIRLDKEVADTVAHLK